MRGMSIGRYIYRYKVPVRDVGDVKIPGVTQVETGHAVNTVSLCCKKHGGWAAVLLK